MLVSKFAGLVYFAVATICTTVPDTWFHRDYCTRTRECAEGTHVMCMYYDPDKAMGPACSENATEVTVVNRYKNLLLNIFNEIRRLAANGEETGKNDKLLPKAYGLKRLVRFLGLHLILFPSDVIEIYKWDDELAVFAQVFANQCSLTRDFCRATSKFHSPGQFTGVNVFKFPDWDISDINKGFHEDKVIAALKNILKRAYFLKKLVTKQLIQNYPNILTTRATDLFDRATILKQLYKIRPYLNIIHGGTSHVGCGISAYANRENFKDQADDGVYNFIELTCNFSGEPTAELPVYETIQPKRLDWSTTCGCPPGFTEDEDCLCLEYGTRNKYEADSDRAARVMSLLQSFATREEKLYNDQVNKFVLPIQHEHTNLPQTYMTEPILSIRNPIVSNNEFHQVRPRKDYSKMSELVTEYINKKRGRKSLPVINYISQNRKLKSEQPVDVKQSTTPEMMIVKKPDRSSKDIDHSTKKESDNLLKLLDKLEYEVKYIELNEHVKDIIDKKMRKIYDSVIHDPKRLMTPDQSDVVNNLIKILNPDDVMVFDADLPPTGDQLTRLLNKNLDEMREDSVKFTENSPVSYGKVDDQSPSLLNINGDDTSTFLENSPDILRKGDDQIAFDPDTPTTEGQLTSLIKKKQDEMGQDGTKFVANFAGSTEKGDIYDRFYRDDKISLDDKLDAYYKSQGGNKPSGGTNREMIQDLVIRDADEVLGSIRRKFYQDKLKDLKRKLESMRGYARPNDDEQNNNDNPPKTELELTNT